MHCGDLIQFFTSSNTDILPGGLLLLQSGEESKKHELSVKILVIEPKNWLVANDLFPEQELSHSKHSFLKPSNEWPVP